MNIYYSKEPISRKQYNKAKTIIKKAIDSGKFSVRPYEWGICWDTYSKKWEGLYPNPTTPGNGGERCCPLGATLLNEQPKKVKPPTPYDKLDKYDAGTSSFFSTSSKLLDLPEDVLMGFIYGVDGSTSPYLKYLNDYNHASIVKVPDITVKNIKNVKSGISLGKWCKKYLHTLAGEREYRKNKI